MLNPVPVANLFSGDHKDKQGFLILRLVLLKELKFRINTSQARTLTYWYKQRQEIGI